LSNHKIQVLLKEQTKIIETLPDGALIFKEVMKTPKTKSQKVGPANESKAKIVIKYLNSTFIRMF